MVRSPAAVVPLARAESVRSVLRSAGILRRDLRVRRVDDVVWLPVTGNTRDLPPGARWAEGDFEPVGGVRSYKQLLGHLPLTVHENLPTGFDVVGDVIVVKIPAPVLPFAKEVASAMLEASAGVRAVFADEGVDGPYRVRTLRRIAGNGDARTTHREFGRVFEVDLTRAYFSPRLAGHHDDVANQVSEGQRVLDATCGVGPYSVAIAGCRPSAQLVAVDINPDALDLLRANLRRNRVQGEVEVLGGDGFEVAEAQGPWDHIIVNLPHGQEDDLLRCVRTLRSGGRLHATRMLDDAGAQAWAGRFVKLANVTLEASQRIHAYSAAASLYAFRFRASAAAAANSAPSGPATPSDGISLS